MIEFGLGFMAGTLLASLIALAWVQYDERAKAREEAMINKLADELSKRQK